MPQWDRIRSEEGSLMFFHYSAILIYWHFWSSQKLSLNCIMSLNWMILCSKLKNGLWKLVSKSQVVAKVGNICLLSPLVLSKWEDLAFSVCIKVCIFFNFWMLKCTIMANKTWLWILSLKIWKKTNFLKKYKN